MTLRRQATIAANETRTQEARIAALRDRGRGIGLASAA